MAEEQQFFNVESDVMYRIECISCGRGVTNADAGRVQRQAEKEGWQAAHTRDEGTENYCPNCKDQIEPDTDGGNEI